MRTLRLLILLCFPLTLFGQATPVVVADICPGGCSSNPTNLVEWNGKVYFFATSPTAGRELHVWDGTSVSVVADIAPGIDFGVNSYSALALLNNKLYFAANDTTGATGHYVYAYDGSNSPQKILLTNGQPLRSRGALATSGSHLLVEYNDSANRYRLARYSPSAGSVQVISQGYLGSYLGLSGIQANADYAVYGGQAYFNSAKAFMCRLADGAVLATPTSHFGRMTMAGDGVYLPYTDIDPSTSANNGSHMSRFRFSPFGWSTLTSGPLSVIRYADLSEPATFNTNIYYPALTTPSSSTNNAPVSLHRYEPSTGTTATVMPLPSAAMTPYIFSTHAELNGVLYLGYASAADGTELFAYTGGTNFVRLTDVDGPSAGLNPTAILSYQGDLLIAGTTSTSGTELYRITGTGLSLTDAQQFSTAILSPNPASTQLTITLPAAGSYNLHILSTTGQTVRTHTLQGSSASISIERLSPGLYFAQITDAATGAAVGTARFVKE